MTNIAGIRPLLFGIAVILTNEFTLIHDLIRYGRDYGPNTGFVQIGLFVGLVICAFGLLLGIQNESAERTRVSDAVSRVDDASRLQVVRNRLGS